VLSADRRGYRQRSPAINLKVSPTPEARCPRPPLPTIHPKTSAQKAVAWLKTPGFTARPERVALPILDSRLQQRSEFFEGPRRDRGGSTLQWRSGIRYQPLIKGSWRSIRNRNFRALFILWHDEAVHWHRSYGNEQWEFDDQADAPARIQHFN